MSEPYAEKLERLVEAVLETPGDLDSDVRRAVEARAAELGGRAAAEAAEVPAELAAYVEKVAMHAYKTTDADIERLKAAGYSEDAIFEVTVATALGAARARLERGLAALEEARER